MSSKPVGPLRKLWYQWKSLRLPWRKRFLVGLDLQGNTYWEFALARGDPTSTISTSPYRRIVYYPRSTHYSDVTVPPAWHQWLRYQRETPPTIQEQSAEKMRQERIKVLAAQADARWEAKPSLLDMPAQQTRAIPSTSQERHDVDAKQRQPDTHTDPSDPWKRAQQTGTPGETWQPEAWTPAAGKKR